MRRTVVLLVALVTGGLLLAPPALAAPPFSTTPREVTRGPAAVPTVTGVRAARHASFDRVVLDLDGPHAGYRLGYVPAVYTYGDGEPIPLDGTAVLRLHVTPAHGHDQDTYRATVPRRLAPRLPAVRELRLVYDFEAHVEFGIGVSQRLGFRVQELANPNRLVIDVAHPRATPAGYARDAFNAWRTRDAATLVRLAQPSAAQLLLARPASERWSGPSCEGAAGSTYCRWTANGVDLVLRVANQDAAAGRPRAVTEAFFQPAAGRVAVWPLTTSQEAANTQRSVDQGHSPWMLEPEAVVDSFARAVLHWDQPILERQGETTFLLTDAATGVTVQVEVGQPARGGRGGIWAVTRLGSLAG